VELQNARQRFGSQGLKLAAISYDSPAILKDFADRHKIEFPLLADPNSEVIRSFNVLNAEAKGMTKGMAYPGFFLTLFPETFLRVGNHTPGIECVEAAEFLTGQY
jgi:peroxiredoxin